LQNCWLTAVLNGVLGNGKFHGSACVIVAKLLLLQEVLSVQGTSVVVVVYSVKRQQRKHLPWGLPICVMDRQAHKNTMLGII